MFRSSNSSSKRDGWELFSKYANYMGNKQFLDDFNALVRQFPNEMAKVDATPEIQFGIYFPTSNIDEFRKAQFIAAIQHFFKCHSPMPLQQNNDYLFISPMTLTNIPQKVFIITFQNCLSCWQQKKSVKDKAFTRGAIAGTFNEIPHEMAAHIGLFVGHKEGGRLACASKEANRLAKEEERRIDMEIKAMRPDLTSCIEIKLAVDEVKAALLENLKSDSSSWDEYWDQYAQQYTKPKATIRDVIEDVQRRRHFK